MAPTMKWDAAADAKLFGLVLNVFDLKFSSEVLKKMNLAIGLDPKSQSISHRLGAARKKAAGIFQGGAVKVVPATTVPLTPRRPKLVGNRSTGKRSTGRSKNVKDESDSEDDDGAEIGTPTIKRESARTAGRKRSYEGPDTDDEDWLESDADVSPAVKKIKTGAKEDVIILGGEIKETSKGVDDDGHAVLAKSFFDGYGELSETEVDTVIAEEPEEV